MQRLCRYFKETGSCRFGDECRNSHDLENTKPRNNLEKDTSRQKVCFRFASTGQCKFGEKCHFAHTRVLKQDAGAPNVASNDESEVVDFLRRVLADPKLSGRNSESLFFVPKSSEKRNWHMFAAGYGGRKQYINSLLAALNGSVNEVENILSETCDKHVVEFSTVITTCLTNINDDEEFLTIFMPIVFLFTHGHFISGPFSMLANPGFAIMHKNIEDFLKVVNRFVPKFASDYTFRPSNIRDIRPYCMAQIILPIVELTFHLCSLFSTVQIRVKDSLLVTILDDSINNWKLRLESNSDPALYDGQLHDVENNMAIVAAKQALRKLATLLNQFHLVKLSQPAKNFKQQSSFPLWAADSLREPGRRHKNDHRDIQKIHVIPTQDEILCTTKPALPGNYLFEPGAHWLPPGPERLFDTHFRLYREDMLRSFRRSIQQFLADARTKNYASQVIADKSITLYTSVEILDYQLDSMHGLVATLAYKPPSSKYRPDRSLQPGTLVALIVMQPGNQVSVNMGYIVFLKKKEGDEQIPKNAVAVSLLETTTSLIFLMNAKSGNLKRANIVLMEARNVLFDAYRPVLEALKTVNVYDLPFQEYICPPEKQSSVTVGPPLYSNSPGFFFDLSFLVGKYLRLQPAAQESRDNCIKKLLEHSTLDDGQAKALISSLCSEYACVQGSPGSGKSFLGLQIVRAILKSTRLRPILIVCYTNHALDQFLAELIDYGITNMARIGSRCQNEKVVPYVVNPRSVDYYNYRSNFYDLKCRQSELEEEFKKIQDAHELGLSWDQLQALLLEYYPNLYFSLSNDDDGFQFVGKNNRQVNIYQKWLYHDQIASEISTSRPLEELLESKNVWEMSRQERYSLASHFKRLVYNNRLERIQKISRELKQLTRLGNGLRDDCLASALERKDIIGMTTSGAANRISMLQKLNPSIILCEEAGEILESHTLSFLTSSVQHFIMIGDHLQLRPHIAEYDLSVENPAGKKYAFDLSQFERLQQDEYGYPLVTLHRQRRMRPEISQFIRQTLYPNLEDSPVVFDYPNILGLKNNVFFFTHQHPEDALVGVKTSHSNMFEARFAVALVKYLLNQGYKPSEITLLTPYLGQLRLLRNELTKISMLVILGDKDEKDLEELEQVIDNVEKLPKKVTTVAESKLADCIRVSTVDNFQGEENRIIVVSLVRNSAGKSESSIGFLGITNRNNVLLSRAKEGLYMIGDAPLLAGKSKMWSTVIDLLQKDHSIGSEISVTCRKHPDYVKNVKTAEEFYALFPDGGCTLRCTTKLSKCGHVCPRYCHSDVATHDAIFCPQPCPRVRDECGHTCPKLCGEDCGLCMVNVGDVELPCSHIYRNMPCWKFQDIGDVNCSVKTSVSLLSCRHEAEVKCSGSIDSIRCAKSCEHILPCSHKCSGVCGKCHESSRHETCNIICGRLLACGHACSSKCHSGNECPPCSKKCTMMQCSHSKCEHGCMTPCLPCIAPCDMIGCEHQPKGCPLPCRAPCISVPCNKRCTKVLQECGHQCPSLCGEICPTNDYCQVCATDDMKGKVVDLIMLEEYRNIDLDKTPIIVFDCGHMKTAESMDGLLELSKFYFWDEESEKWRDDTFPEAPNTLTKPPECPDCRQKIVNVNRYRRIICFAQIDQAEKRYIQIASAKINELNAEFVKLLSLSDKERGSAMTWEFNRKFEALLKNNIFRSPIEHLSAACYQKLDSEKKLDLFPLVSLPTPQFRLKAQISLLWSDYHALSLDFSNPDKSIKSLKNRYKHAKTALNFAKKSSNTILQQVCELKCAETTYDKLRFVSKFRSYNLLLKKMTIPTPPSAMIDFSTKLCEQYKLLLVKGTITFLNEHRSHITKRIEALEGFQKYGEFRDIRHEEMVSVYKAMENELRGTGHWYRCPNGHLFVIGECGMAMQQSNCPECGEAIGGAHHQLVPSNTAATDFERDMARGH